MKPNSVLLGVLAMVGACAPPAATGAGDTTDGSDSTPAAAAPDADVIDNRILSEAELVGAYRIAGLDGEDLDAPFGASVLIVSGTLTFEAQCATYSWRFSIVDGVIALTPASQPPRSCLDSGALHPKVGEIARGLGETQRAARTPSNAIELSGGGRSVTLFTQ